MRTSDRVCMLRSATTLSGTHVELGQVMVVYDVWRGKATLRQGKTVLYAVPESWFRLVVEEPPRAVVPAPAEATPRPRSRTICSTEV